MLAIKRSAYSDPSAYKRAVDALSIDMPSAPMSGGMAFFRDEAEKGKCIVLDSVVRGDGFYIDYGDTDDLGGKDVEYYGCE